MGKSTISMAIYHSYLSLPEGNYILPIWITWPSRAPQKTAAQGAACAPITNGRAAHHLIGPQASNPPVLSPGFEVMETAEVEEYL